MTAVRLPLVVLSLAGACLLLFNRARTLSLMEVSLAGLLIIARPALGVGLYLLMYPLVPSEESISSLKVAIFGLTLLLLFVWGIQRVLKGQMFFTRKEYFFIYLFFIFLCLSPLLGIYNGFTSTDWARDIAPLLNLLLLPLMVDYFSVRKYRWLPYLVFAPLGLGMLRDILVLLGNYGISFGALDALRGLPFAAIHPSLGLALGLTMYMLRTREKNYWLLLAVMSLIVTFLTPTRTVWITTGTMLVLFVVFSTRRRVWAIGSIAVLTAAAGWLIFYNSDPGLYVESQKERVEQLGHYSQDLSTQNRIEEMEQAGALFASSPICGMGFGFQYNFWRPFIGELGPGYLDTNFTHNDILFIASKGGILGLILFGLMLYALAKKLFLRMRETSQATGSAWATVALLSLVNSLIMGLSTPVFQTRSAMFVLVVLLAMGLVQRDDGKAQTVDNYRQLQR